MIPVVRCKQNSLKQPVNASNLTIGMYASFKDRSHYFYIATSNARSDDDEYLYVRLITEVSFMYVESCTHLC